MPNGAEWRLGSLQRRLCSKLCAIPGTHRDPLLFLGPLAISAKQHHMLVYIQSSAILVSGEAVYAFLHSKLSNPIYMWDIRHISAPTKFDGGMAQAKKHKILAVFS